MKKIKRIHTIETEYFVDDNFEIEIKELLMYLEMLEENGKYSDDVDTFLELVTLCKGIGLRLLSLRNYLVVKNVLFLKENTYYCNEEARHELYYCVLKVFNSEYC